MTEFKPYRRVNGEMLVDIGSSNITDREYFAVKDGVNALLKEDPAQHRALMNATKANNPEQTNKIWGEIRDKHPEIHAKMIGQNAGEIVSHIASGQPVRPMVDVNGRPFSTRVIEGEISASIRDSSTTRAPTRLDDVRQNTLRLSGSGKVEGAFHVDAEKVVPMMAEKHVQIIDDGKSAKVAQWSQLSRHAPSNVATAEAQVLSSLMHDAKKVAGNNIVVKALLAGGAMVTAGAASAMDAPEGQKLEAGFKGAVKAGAEHLVPGITEKDKCVAQGKSWGNVGAAFGAAGLTGGVAFFTGGVGLVGGVATSAIGGGAGQIIGEALGEGVCRLAQSAKEGISSENLAMIKHRPTTQTVASTKTPDSSVTQAPSQGVAASRG